MGIQADSILQVPVLLSNLSDDVKLEMSRGVEDDKRKLDDLLKKLIDKITARERCTITPASPPIRSLLDRPQVPPLHSAWGHTCMSTTER